jgi:hypothetical protein
MSNSNIITYGLFYLMLFSPVLSYITFGLLGQPPIYYYLSRTVFLYGMFYLFFFNKKIIIPKSAWYLIGYIIFLFIWSIFTGEFARKPLGSLSNNIFIDILFILLIINNTKFTDRFINRSILIIKITVVIATVASIIQVFDSEFLNATPIWQKNEEHSIVIQGIYAERRVSIFGYVDPAELGLSYMPILSIFIGYLLYYKSKSYIYFLVFGGITAFLSNTRFIMVSFLIITIQIFISENTKYKGMLKYLIYATLGAFLFYQLLTIFGYNLEDWYNQRLFAEGSIKETTRYKAIDNFLIFFPEKTLLGYGGPTEEMTKVSNEAGSSQIHVGYLAGLVYYGIVGCFFLFGFWFQLAKKFFKTAKLTRYWGSFFAFLTFLWANATLVSFQIFFVGLIFTLILDKYFNDKYIANIKFRLKEQSKSL